MKKIVSKIIRNEGGQALPAVLALLLLGGFLIAPLMTHMSSGLNAGLIHEERTEELYAAGAGIEDAIWKMQNDQIPPDDEQPWHLTVNDKDVAVWSPPPPADDAMITFFATIGVLSGTGGDYKKARPNAEWLVVYSPIESGVPGEYDSYRITGYYRETPPRRILSTGFWLRDYTGDVEVIPWDPGQDGSLLIDTNLDGTGDTTVDTWPLVEGFTPVEYREVPYLGTSYIWEWASAKGPIFGQNAEDGEDVICRTQRFSLDPSLVLDGSDPHPDVAWLRTQTDDIQISWIGEATAMEGILAIATDPVTDKSTAVKSYVFTDAEGSTTTTTILTWEIDPPPA